MAGCACVRRYYGINDPVANKMLRRVGDMPKLETPEDTSITTLWVARGKEVARGT